MIHKVDNEDRVYIIGQHTKYTKNVLLFIAFIVAGILSVIAGVYLYNKQTCPQKTSQGKSLEEVEVISRDATAPKFMGNKNFQQFLVWIGKNLKYPHGHENENAEVIVAFTISKEGTITDIQILLEPQNKAFGQQVVSLLKQCPRWAPGRLANGTATDIRYTLPVRFSKIRK